VQLFLHSNQVRRDNKVVNKERITNKIIFKRRKLVLIHLKVLLDKQAQAEIMIGRILKHHQIQLKDKSLIKLVKL
jgi:hypothetical protein